MNWTKLWFSIFGTDMLAGIDMGFWVSMGISLLVAILMNVVFWSMRPYKKEKTEEKQLSAEKEK